MATAKDAAASNGTDTSSKLKDSLQSVDINNTTISQTFNHVHTLAVLAGFLSTFSALVADPIKTMLGMLGPLALLQTAWAIICLPGTPPSTGQTKSKKSKQENKDASLGAKVVPALLSLTLSLALAGPLLSVALILFGAPFTTLQPQTILAGCHIALLSSPALFYIHGVSGERWMRVASVDVPLDAAHGAALGALLGAWVGAVPIPLDWDREWQRWPVTVVVGAYGGWALGKVVGGTVAKGARIRIN